MTLKFKTWMGVMIRGKSKDPKNSRLCRPSRGWLRGRSATVSEPGSSPPGVLTLFQFSIFYFQFLIFYCSNMMITTKPCVLTVFHRLIIFPFQIWVLEMDLKRAGAWSVHCSDLSILKFPQIPNPRPLNPHILIITSSSPATVTGAAPLPPFCCWFAS